MTAPHRPYRISSQKHLSREVIAERTKQMWDEKGIPSPETLRERRLDLGFSREDVARFTGATEQTVIRWERGERVPSGQRLYRYLRLLGMGRRSQATASTDSGDSPEVLAEGTHQ